MVRRRRRLWVALSLSPLWCGAVISACASNVDYPPLITGPYEAGSASNNGHTQGSEAGNTPCVEQGGVCLGAGDIGEGGLCPVSLSFSCGPGSTSESGVPILICCGGLNDAGPPDVITDADGA
jgi:hypothetical protein